MSRCWFRSRSEGRSVNAAGNAFLSHLLEKGPEESLYFSAALSSAVLSSRGLGGWDIKGFSSISCTLPGVLAFDKETSLGTSNLGEGDAIII